MDNYKAYVLKGIDQTLAQQLDITDREIASRKALLGFTEQDAEVLKQYKPLFEKYIDGIIKNFYDRQIAISEVALVIGDAETLRRLQNAMRSYILELFDGFYDAEYVNKRLRIGKVHMRIGVSPKLYMSAIYMLQKIIKDAVKMHFFGKEEDTDAGPLYTALNKLIMFDIQLVFDTYVHGLVSEVRTAKEELAEYASSLEKVVEERTQQLHELSRRDELTNLFNQRGLREHLRREMANAVRYKEHISLMYFDLNGFKKLNDNEGHQAGDDVLKLTGEAIAASIRDTDIGCRYGGDEFCIILPRTAIAETQIIYERLVKFFKDSNKDQGITFSVGVSSTGPDDYCDADTLIKNADQLMYQAKAQSKKKKDFYIVTE